MANSVKLQFNTDAELADRVQRLASRTGSTVSAVLALLVRSTLDGHGDAFAELARRYGDRSPSVNTSQRGGR